MSRIKSDPTTLTQCKGITVKPHLVFAIADYEIPGKGFLPLHANDIIYIIEADASGWWLGMNLAGRKGVLPSTYTVPYVFPLPQKETVAELELLRLGQGFGVDLTSGVPAISKDVLAAASPLAPLHAAQRVRPSSLDELYKCTDAAIVERETRRGEVLTCLRTLRDVAAKERCSPKTADNDPGDAGKGALTSPSQRMDPLQECQAAVQKEEESLRRVVRDMVVRKSSVLRRPCHAIVSSSCELSDVKLSWCPPPHTWYHRAQQSLVDASLSDASLLDAFGATAELGDLKAAVRMWEDALTELSANVKEKEAQYRHERESVEQRIQLRDEAVSRMLVWWADKAEEARSEYLATKAQRMRQAEVKEQEVRDMNHELQAKRHQFTELAAELDAVRLQAKAIKRSLCRRDELSELEAQIALLSKKVARARRADHHAAAVK